MRSQVAAALVVCGTLFAVLPSISDLLHDYQVSQFLAERTIQTGITRINQPFGVTFRAAAWILGGAMIGLAILGSLGKQSDALSRSVELDSPSEWGMLNRSESQTW